MRQVMSDTLFRRLFILMWVALVGSHVLAFSVVMLIRQAGPMRNEAPRGGPGMPFMLPTFPSLPPSPDLFGRPAHAPGPAGSPPPPWLPGETDHMQPGPGPGGMPTWLLLIDYGIRLIVIGSAAWWGARWLSRPMHHLAEASRTLSDTLDEHGTPARLVENEGTVEVRATAKVFNDMAAKLSQQFRTRGLMMAAISHDLRTPLTRIRIRMESLADASMAERCISDVREMNELIDSSLEVFRGMESGEQTQITDVLALVQSVCDDLVEQGQPVSFTGHTAITRAKPLSLRRVIINLITNAVRYGEHAWVSVGQAQDQVVITIEDEGPGIPPEHLTAVFEPFYRIESSRNRHTGGMGLGLYIAQDLITRQSGTLTLSNRKEGGLRAIVHLPMSPPVDT
jgi:signal transduction histidine kinase